MQQTLIEAREEIVQVLAKNLPKEQVNEVRQLLANYFAQKATMEFDNLAEKNNWDKNTYDKWLSEKLRTDY